MSSTLHQTDEQIIVQLVAAARAAGLTHFSGSFSSASSLKHGYSSVSFAWETGRHGSEGVIKIRWDAAVPREEKLPS
jgi:hypothetical protein